jgi:hypothetical protein
VVPQQVNKFPAFYGIRRFITAFTRALDCTEGSVRIRSFWQYFVTWFNLNGEELWATRLTPKPEDHLLSALRDCLFNIYVATLHIWRSFLHPQPENVPCSSDRDPLITVPYRGDRDPLVTVPCRGDRDPLTRRHAVVTGTHLHGAMRWWQGPTYHGAMPRWQGRTYHGAMPWWQGPTYTAPCRGDRDPLITAPCRGDRDPLITVPCRGDRDALITVPCRGDRDPLITVPCQGDRDPLITVPCRGDKDPLITVPCRGDRDPLITVQQTVQITKWGYVKYCKCISDSFYKSASSVWGRSRFLIIIHYISFNYSCYRSKWDRRFSQRPFYRAPKSGSFTEACCPCEKVPCDQGQNKMDIRVLAWIILLPRWVH